MNSDTKTLSNSLARRLRRLGLSERIEEAVAFIRRFHRENNLPIAKSKQRQAEVVKSLRRTGHYTHTIEEIAFGARVAWRNHARCIGRLFWQSLEVIDCRHVKDEDEMVGHIFSHLANAFGDGGIKSTISIFSPVEVDKIPAYVESKQVIQYAGYFNVDGSFLGDRQNIESTKIAMDLGWQPPEPRGLFDVLPLIVRDRRGRRRIYDLPKSILNEVMISHPEIPILEGLGLKWYSVPTISGMILTIGGIDYPCAPFNGYYMCTEIASRDFADENRYNLLPTIADALGFQSENLGVFWKDRTLTELNRAILHSFDEAGVTMTDHHTASQQYFEFMQREHTEGREPPANWSWIVPPQASAACPVFHLQMQNKSAVPNFYNSRASDGAYLTPSYDDENRSKNQRRLDRIKRRYRNYLRKTEWAEKLGLTRRW